VTSAGSGVQRPLDVEIGVVCGQRRWGPPSARTRYRDQEGCNASEQTLDPLPAGQWSRGSIALTPSAATSGDLGTMSSIPDLLGCADLGPVGPSVGGLPGQTLGSMLLVVAREVAGRT
jgi:hypothetical protein